MTSLTPSPDSAKAWRRELPVAQTDLDTFTTARRLQELKGPLAQGSPRKLEAARHLFADHVDTAALLAAIDTPASDVRTPLMFQHQLMERARSARRNIVLPESTDDRILTAADVVLRRGVADITLIGDRAEIASRAASLGLDLSAAKVVSNHDPDAAGQVRRGVRPRPRSQGRHLRPGPRSGQRHLLLRHDDGSSRPGGRHGLRARSTPPHTRSGRALSSSRPSPASPLFPACS